MQKEWKVLDPAPQSFFDEHPEVPATIAHLLYHRNIRTQRQIDEFLNPDYSVDVHDPFLFRDMERAVARLFDAIEKKEKIVIHGDYDADGVSASTILMTTLKNLGQDTKICCYWSPRKNTWCRGLQLVAQLEPPQKSFEV